MSRLELSPAEFSAEWNRVGQRWVDILRIEDQARRGETRDFNRNRGKSRYEESLLGLSHYLDYLRTVPGSKLLIDVGAGAAKATQRIQQDSDLGKDLDVMATGLAIEPTLWRHIGPDRFRRTPIERMDGFQDNSVAGMLGVNSIAYSASPMLAVARIDDLLVPGGAIKATFSRSEKTRGTPSDFMAHHNRFSGRFRALEYDVAIIENIGEDVELDVLLAIKPGNSTGITAEELINRDKEAFWEKQDELYEILNKTND